MQHLPGWPQCSVCSPVPRAATTWLHPLCPNSTHSLHWQQAPAAHRPHSLQQQKARAASMLRDCWLPANLPRHTGMPTRVHSVQALAAEQLDYWDVVEYQHPIGSTRSGSQNPALRLGLVQQVGSDAVQLSPLVEEDEGVWVPESDDAEAPEQQEVVPLERVKRIVETVYGQRQDKEHNPHGEHAHDVWQVVVPLSPGVFRGADSKS